MVVDAIVEKSGKLKYGINLIDPYANKIQAKCNTTVVDDMNRLFREIKKKGLSQGGHWETWDSKSTYGREQLKSRLKNSVDCKEPYSNMREEDGIITWLPTIWINYEKCPNVRKSIAKWSTNINGKPEQAHSHFCTAIEAILKDIRFKAKMNIEEYEAHNPYAKYFHLKGRVA